MEVAEAIGFIHFWGFTPARNFLDQTEDKSSVNLLISGTGDVRHLLKSLSDISTQEREVSLNVYLHETSAESLARHLLLLLVVNDTELPVRERVEFFLDVYGNALNRERTSEYISMRAKQLVHIVTEHRLAPPVKELFDLSGLKFKERDQLEEIFKSWDSKVPFDLEGLRDQRLRYHYKERYDYRVNLADWDYQWSFKENAPQVRFRQYKDWRMTGVAYEFRLATYNIPNRTLSGYIPGEKKQTRESCLVRGYWGDIVMSPYWAFGLEVDCCAECNKILNKEANGERVHHAQDVSEYNLERMITRLETLQDYHFPPEKDRMNLYRKYWKGEEIKAEEVPEETDFGSIRASSILAAFAKFNVKVIPLLEPIPALSSKRKFAELFDIAVLGSASSGQFADSLSRMCKPGSTIAVETLNNLVILKPDQKETAVNNLANIATQAGWNEVQRQHDFLQFTK